MSDRLKEWVADEIKRIRATRTIRIESVGGQVEDDGRILEEGAETYIDNEGITTVEHIHDKFLGCSHLAKSRDNVAGKCEICEALCCQRCLSACMDCVKLLCPKHQYRANSEILCEDCFYLRRARKILPFL